MLSILLPPTIGRSFPGHSAGVVLFGLLTLFELVISVGSTVNARGAAVGADNIPVDSYGADGAAAFLSLFSTLGASGVALASVSLVALVRYRALVPLLALVYALLAIAKRAVNQAFPMPGRPSSDDWLTLGTVLLTAYLLVLLLAFWRKAGATQESASPA